MTEYHHKHARENLYFTSCCCLDLSLLQLVCSVALKLVPSTVLANSVSAQEMGSGEYNFVPDSVITFINTIARLNPTSLVSGPAAAFLKACLQGCSNVNLCSGVVFGQYTAEDGIPAGSCKLIMGKSLPGNSLRTLIKANFMGLNTNLKVSPGYFSQPGSSKVEVCPGTDEGTAGWFW
jgi:hypothetical protein